MSDLIAFLNARLSEDERKAADVRPVMGVHSSGPLHAPGTVFTEAEAYGPNRARAEVAAKRSIIFLHDPVILHAGHPLVGPGPGAWRRVCRSCEPLRNYHDEAWPCPTLLALASVYRDHPEWREEWTA